ncbi:ferric reductase-like transmembrane domain-containing protein, partial [Micromonospora zhanjiangensis]
MSTANAARTRPPVARRLPVTPRWWGDLVGSAALLSLVVVTALWIGNRGLQELSAGPGPGLTSIGRLAGLVSADLMLIQVVLMARVPWIERSYGQDRIARWHRLAGFTSFNLLLGHVLLTTLGYSATAEGGPLGQFWLLVTTYPGMLLATAALALLVMVVVTSLRAARRRLRYESWHLLHLYAYLGTGLALPHQLWTGADFISSPGARAYWWGLYGVAAGSVLVFRLAVPAWRSARHRLEVTAVVPEAPGVTSVHLRGRHLHRLPVRAGQFFLWRFLDGPGWSRAHPFSLSAPPYGDQLRITVKDLGDGSARVARLRPGTKALIEGPYGRLTGESFTGGGVTMLACGVGVTPLLALLWELPYAPGRAVLVYRARSVAELAFRHELDRLAAQRGVRVHYLLGPRAGRASSWVSRDTAHLSDVEVLRWYAPDVAGHDVYVCGPDAWADAA